MRNRGPLRNRAMRAPGWGEAVMSQMHFVQFAYYGVQWQEIEPRSLGSKFDTLSTRLPRTTACGSPWFVVCHEPHSFHMWSISFSGMVYKTWPFCDFSLTHVLSICQKCSPESILSYMLNTCIWRIFWVASHWPLSFPMRSRFFRKWCRKQAILRIFHTFVVHVCTSLTIHTKLTIYASNESFRGAFYLCLELLSCAVGILSGMSFEYLHFDWPYVVLDLWDNKQNCWHSLGGYTCIM